MLLANADTGWDEESYFTSSHEYNTPEQNIRQFLRQS
jgi:hypothetical protein